LKRFGNGETLRFLNQNVQNFAADDFKIGLDTSKWTLTWCRPGSSPP
jgi:hypothetical protein